MPRTYIAILIVYYTTGMTHIKVCLSGSLRNVPIARPEDSYRVCVCVCVSLSTIRFNNNPQHLLWSERENQQDATVRCLFLTISQHVSGIIMPTFRRTKTVCYCMWCAALVLLDVVGSGCGALCCRVRAL